MPVFPPPLLSIWGSCIVTMEGNGLSALRDGPAPGCSSLAARAAISPHSPVAVLDALLAPVAQSRPATLIAGVAGQV